VLHGGFGTGDGAARQTGFDDEAARHGFLVAYPDGIGRSWNAITCCGPAQRRQVDDVGFLVSLISACEGGTAVELDMIRGGGHSWPGGDRMSPLLDPPSTALDATASLWRFFAAHPRRL
jgi:polyhydroxybutyrate depolymerase